MSKNNENNEVNVEEKSTTADNSESTSVGSDNVKTFTQEEVNHIVSERLARFNEEKINERVKEKLSEIENEKNSLSEELRALKYEKEVNTLAATHKVDANLLTATGLSGEALSEYAEKLAAVVEKPVEKSVGKTESADEKINSFINGVFTPRQVSSPSDRSSFIKNFEKNNK